MNRKLAVEIIKNIEDLIVLFQNSMKNLSDPNEIKNKLNLFKNQFSQNFRLF